MRNASIWLHGARNYVVQSHIHHIILPTIKCTTTRKTVERNFGPTSSAKVTYEHICEVWNVSTKSSASVLIDKSEELTNAIQMGCSSASLKHVTEFVEKVSHQFLPATGWPYKLPTSTQYWIPS